MYDPTPRSIWSLTPHEQAMRRLGRDGSARLGRLVMRTRPRRRYYMGDLGQDLPVDVLPDIVPDVATVIDVAPVDVPVIDVPAPDILAESSTDSFSAFAPVASTASQFLTPVMQAALRAEQQALGPARHAA